MHEILSVVLEHSFTAFTEITISNLEVHSAD